MKQNVTTNHNRQYRTYGYACELEQLSEPDQQYQFSKLVI